MHGQINTINQSTCHLADKTVCQLAKVYCFFFQFGLLKILFNQITISIFHNIFFNKYHLKRYMFREIDPWFKYQHTENVVSDNMGLVGFTLRVTEFYHLASEVF